MIEINQLAKNYNGTRALDGFSLRVGEGELVGLVGPNGAGKTTLIKILSTLLAPNGGEAYVAGLNVVREPRAVRALVGYLPDVPGLYQDMRVSEFLEFFADAFHLTPARKRAAVEEALDRAGLAARRQLFVEQLSLGLKQRLLLAKTLLHGPKVLLLDEPATGLDPLARIELREQLKGLSRQAVTILVSSHILSDLEDICSRVALIANGRNAADAQGRTVLDLRQPEELHLICEIEVVGDPDPAVAALASFPEARLLEATGACLRVELVAGGAKAAALLRHLVDAGVAVLRFDPRPPALEERYRQTFGARQS